jgi:hypothetical protein
MEIFPHLCIIKSIQYYINVQEGAGDMEQKKIIEFRNIVKSFEGQVILKGVNLDIYEYEFVTL